MELKTFTDMLRDKHALNFTRLKYKFGPKNFTQYLETLMDNFYTKMPLLDFKGEPVVVLPSKINLKMQHTSSITASHGVNGYGLKAMEDEILATLSIEQINSSRASVRRILHGGAPQSRDEYEAFGLKRGLDFIAHQSNKITEANLYILYNLVIGDFLQDDDQLKTNHFYRHDEVFVVGQDIEHQGIAHHLLPEYMRSVIDYIHLHDGQDHMVKSIILHYYLVCLHPYFDGNGRMARLLQLWYLAQQGYAASLFIPFSAYINRTKGLYYKAFSVVANNYRLSKILDVTPFVIYFVDHVIGKLPRKAEAFNALEEFNILLKKGEFTAKEKDLFFYVLSAYGTGEFSTKQLERDYQNAAYATIRGFVLKFTNMGLLAAQKYGNRVRYSVKQ